MRIILEVVSGPSSGARSVLVSGQQLRVGRTEWADFPVPNDRHMSGVHFALSTDEQGCYVEDLGSSNGTLVAGRQIDAKVAVHDGDEIQAGATRFVVHVEGTPHKPPADFPSTAILRQRPASTAAPASAPAPAARRPEVVYTAETCDSGLWLYRGKVEEIEPAELAALLTKTYPLYLIVDFNKLGASPPEDLGSPEYLFDWLDPTAAEAASPWVFGHKETAGWPALVDEGWGADAVVCLFSTQNQPALLEHLRRTVRVKSGRNGQGDAILGYCWPSVMGPLLAHSNTESVEKLLEGIDAVLVELPDLPETWQLYGGEALSGVLNRLGFVEKSREYPARVVGEGSTSHGLSGDLPAS
jgi:hypothetical protein